MRRWVSLTGVWLAVAVAGGAELTPDRLAERAAVIRPSADELKWQRIPWVTDLAEGRRLAAAERRPLLLWVTGDDPLERC
jgi:hypothetical protein